jgi:hypothetical protein
MGVANPTMLSGIDSSAAPACSVAASQNRADGDKVFRCIDKTKTTKSGYLVSKMEHHEPERFD